MKTLNDVHTIELEGIEPPPLRRGRKPEGARAMTDAERAARYRERKAERAQTATPIPDLFIQTPLVDD